MKKSLVYLHWFWGNSYPEIAYINKILKIQSNEQKNISTIERKKERNKHGFMDRTYSANGRKVLRVEELKEDISWLFLSEKHNKIMFEWTFTLLFLVSPFYTLSGTKNSYITFKQVVSF
jgi:ribosomal protein L34